MQEGLLERFAAGCVVRGSARGVVKENRAVHLTVIVIFGDEDFAVADGLAVCEHLFLDDDSESVARARVGVKIQVPAKNISQLHGELGTFAGLLDSIEEGAIDFASDSVGSPG